MRAHLPLCRKVQAAARTVLTKLGPTIRSSDSEQTIVERAVSMLRDRGLTETWYYDCPALVLSGERSCLSVSGRGYEPSDAPLGAFNLVTVDLSPCRGPIWGDCARRFCIEHSRYTVAPNDHEFSQGLKAEQDLHEFVRGYASRERTFGELYLVANERLDSLGFENLDFLGNLGHSIERNLGDRIFVEENNDVRLGEVRVFTFEPHIRKFNGRWGFKHENIYFFSRNGSLEAL